MSQQVDTELDESSVESSTAVPPPQKSKPKTIKRWDPEKDSDVTHQKKKFVDFFKSPWDVLRNEWRCLLAEFVATMMFVFMATALLVSYKKDKDEGGDLGAGLVSISLGIGIALSTMIYTVANISGGHLNPAVTIALTFIRQVELFKALGYVACQMGGGIVGAALMYGIMPSNTSVIIHMGATQLSPGVTPGEGCAIEICLTFILVFTVCATAELSGDLTSMGRFAPLAIGYSVLVGNMIGVPFTGASMNPARSFGPAVVSNHWENHWIYWVGPIVGAIFAAVLYHMIFILDDQGNANTSKNDED